MKVDNLAHIGYGGLTSTRSLVIVNSMIGASVRIAEKVWVAPSVSIIGSHAVELS